MILDEMVTGGRVALQECNLQLKQICVGSGAISETRSSHGRAPEEGSSCYFYRNSPSTLNVQLELEGIDQSLWVL